MEGGANFATMNPGDALRSMADTGGEAIKSTIKSAGGADRIVDLITKSLA